MRRCLLAFIALLSSFSLPAAAQKVAGEPASSQAVSMLRITLGDSAAELFGPWKFHTGDDLTWAHADFDDSKWGTMDLTPPNGTADAARGSSGFIPGWTKKGYPGYAGYAWYRLRVEVQGSGARLALKMPANADDAYQVYVNGEQIGEFGKFTDRGVTAYSGLPRGFRLPTKIRSGPVTISIRMWMDGATRFNSPAAGGMHGPPVLGNASVIASQVQLDWDDNSHLVGSGFLEVLVLLLALLVAMSLTWLDREEE